jgi:hypothetical protein
MHHPPFCPNPRCREHWRGAPHNELHQLSHPSTSWWIHDGSYHTTRSGTVRRFRCTTCGRHFSEATFSLDYFAKKRINLYRLRNLLVNGSSIRAAARQLFVSPTTITHRIMVLARQSIALHGTLTETVVPQEDLVADGFQSFWVSQYHPNNFNLLAGADSQYLYAMTSVTLRRSGRMTKRQRQKRDNIESRDPPDPGALARSFHELLHEGTRLWSRMPKDTRILRSDEHPTYARCLQRWQEDGIRQMTTPSTQLRSATNPLFAVNYLDREIRKDMAEHHRETMCFARHAALSTARMWTYLVWHNVDKAYRISPHSSITHVEAAGISREGVRQIRRGMMTRRAFFTRSRLNHTLRTVWMGMMPTPERENRTNSRLTPGYCMG